jgi:hypothetical protein
MATANVQLWALHHVGHFRRDPLGIARLPDGRRKHDLYQAANEIFAAFPRQVLPFDLAAATAYADVVAGREGDGNPISGFDGQIAAICRSQAAARATRNTKDFIDTVAPCEPPHRRSRQSVGPGLTSAAAPR